MENRLNKAAQQAKRDDEASVTRADSALLPNDIKAWSAEYLKTPATERSNRWSPLIGNYSTYDPTATQRKQEAAELKLQEENDYGGLWGFLRGMGENALEGIRSANAGISAWLADAGDWLAEHTGGLIDPGANISLVDTDPQAAAAAARAATSAIRETAADTEKDREYWRQRGQEAKDYLGERQEEIDTGEDVEILTQKGVDAQQRAAEIREAALEDRGIVGQVLFDVGSTGLQWVYDALLGALIPGGALASAGLRGAGSGMLEARLAGANLGQQLLYGIGTGGVEVLTEKISNISNTLTRVFGKGFSDGVVNRLINRLTTNAAGRSVLRTLASAGGEGVEEMVSDVVNPFLQLIYDGDALDQMGTWDYWGDVLYDGLVGSVFGGVVQGAETGVNRLRGNRGGNTAQTSTNTDAVTTQTDVSSAQNQAPNTQTGADTTAPAETAVEAPTAPQTATEVEALLSSGTVSNSVAERIINTPELRAQFEALTGQQLTGTKSEMRNTIKEFARQRAADAAVERFEADVAEMNGEGVTQTPQAANVSEIPNSSPVQDVNAPVTPDSSVVSPTDSLGAAPRGYSVGHAPEIVENQRHAVENVVSPENLNPAQTHERLSNRDREYYAQQRLGVDLEGEMAELPTKQNWDATDAQTAFDILRMAERRANETRSEADIAELAKWQALIDRKGSGVGQTLQVYAAQARQSGDPAVVVADAANILAAEEARTNAPQDAKAADAVARGVSRAVRNARKDISTAFNDAGEGKRPSKHGGIVQQVEGQMSLDLGRAEVTRSPEQIQRDIRAALKDIGTTINQVARGDRSNDANLQTQISTILQQKYGFTPGEATNVGEVVSNYFNQMVVDESNRILANTFKTREPSVQKTFEERLNEMVNLGAFSNENYAQLASDALFGGALNLQNPEHRRVLTEVYDYARRLADIPEGDTASTIQLINELSSRRRTDSLIGDDRLDGMKNWALNQIAQREGGAQFLHDLALSQIRQITNDYRHRSASDYIFGVRYLNLLSGIPTVLRNLAGNPAFSLVETNSNNVGVLIDSLLSKKTGQRTMALDRSMFSSAARQGAMDAFLRSYLEVAFDADVSNAQNRYGQGGGRTFRMSGNPLERFFSTWEKWNRYMLTTTDETAKGAARGEVTRGLQALQDRGADVSDEFIADRANQVALERTFQNDSRAARASQHIQSGLNEISHDILGRTAIPFAKIGANVSTQYANYSPAGMVNATTQLIKTLRDTHRGTITPEQQAQTAMAFGRTLTGGSLIAMFTALALKGILTVASGGDEKELDRAEGLNGTQLNLSAAWRWLNGESTEYQDGDELLNIGFLEPINGLMSMGSMIADDIEENPDASFWQRLGSVGQASAAGLFQALSELPAMTGLQEIQNAFTYADGEEVGDIAANAALDYLGSQLSSFVVPNFVTNIAEGLDPYVRAPWQADSRAEELMYQFMADIPGLRQNVPVRQDIWGQDMTYTDSDAMNFANQTVLPGTITNYRTNWANQEIRRLGELPPKMPTSFTIDNEDIEMNQDQQREYARAWGDAALQSILALEGNPTYESLSDADKKAVIDNIYDYASGVAKKAIDDRYELSGTIEKAQEYGNPGEYFMFNEALKNIEDSKGADTAAFDAVMEDYAKMDASEQNTLVEMLGENTRFDDIVEAYEAGISPEEWYDAYDKYKELDANGNLSANDAATEFAKWLDTESKFTEQQQSLLEEQLGFFTQLRANSDRYDALIDAGFAPAKADAVYDAVSALEPEQGKTQVSDQQRYEAIVGTSGLTEQEKVDALTEYEGTSSGDKQKFKTAYAYGISPDEYVAFLGLKEDGVGDADGNGSYKADETTALVNAFLEMYPDASRADAALLWAMTNKSKSGNPFANFNQEMIEWDIAP